MKTAILAMLVSFSTLASECYQRSGELSTREVGMAREFCVNSLKLNLEVFGNSQALLNYSLDGKVRTKTISLARPITRPDGKVLFFVYGLESQFVGGGCSDSVESRIEATLLMNKDATDAKLIDIKGVVLSSPDNCHSDMREIQSLEFSKI